MDLQDVNSRHVLVTTDHRGVFVGTLTQMDDTHVVLEDARNVIYWPPENKGVFGLAADGPKCNARIGPVVPRLMVYCVTSICDMTPKAVKAFEGEIWV